MIVPCGFVPWYPHREKVDGKRTKDPHRFGRDFSVICPEIGGYYKYREVDALKNKLAPSTKTQKPELET